MYYHYVEDFDQSHPRRPQPFMHAHTGMGSEMPVGSPEEMEPRATS